MLLNWYKKAGAGGGVWTPVFTGAFQSNSTGWNTWAMRQRIGAGDLLDASATNIRFTMHAFTSGITVGECWFGKAGAGSLDFDGTQIPVTFNGGSVGATVAGNADLVTDAIPFTYTGTNDLAIFYYFSGPTDLVFYSGMFVPTSNGQRNFNDHGTTIAGGYVLSAGINAFKLIEVS